MARLGYAIWNTLVWAYWWVCYKMDQWWYGPDEIDWSLEDEDA